MESYRNFDRLCCSRGWGCCTLWSEMSSCGIGLTEKSNSFFCWIVVVGLGFCLYLNYRIVLCHSSIVLLFISASSFYLSFSFLSHVFPCGVASMYSISTYPKDLHSSQIRLCHWAILQDDFTVSTDYEIVKKSLFGFYWHDLWFWRP